MEVSSLDHNLKPYHINNFCFDFDSITLLFSAACSHG